jgi:hypothetical protein
MRLSFIVCLVGMAALWATLVRFELAAKGTRGDLRRIRRALEGEEAPAAAPSSIAPVVSGSAR